MVCSSLFSVCKKCVYSLVRKLDSKLALRMSFASEFQTFGAATQNARLAVSVRVHSIERRGASVDRRHRVVTWRCISSSMYGGTEVDRAFCLITAIWYWMHCWIGTSALLTDDPGDVVLSSLRLLADCNRSPIQQRVAVVDSWWDGAAGNGLRRFSNQVFTHLSQGASVVVAHPSVALVSSVKPSYSLWQIYKEL